MIGLAIGLMGVIAMAIPDIGSPSSALGVAMVAIACVSYGFAPNLVRPRQPQTLTSAIRRAALSRHQHQRPRPLLQRAFLLSHLACNAHREPGFYRCKVLKKPNPPPLATQAGSGSPAPDNRA